MSFDITQIAVSKILTTSDASNLFMDISFNDGNVYISDLRYPKAGLSFNNLPYYGSKTEFSVDGSYVIVRSDGDPYPAKAGASLGYLYSTPINDITTRLWYDDPNLLGEKPDIYKFIYRGGTNTDSSDILYNSGGINGIFANGVAYLSPMGGQSFFGNMNIVDNFYLNAYYFINFLGKDKLTGHPEEDGTYHYHTGAFLYNGWNNPVFYNSNSYYKNTYYSIPNTTPNPYYNKLLFSDTDNSGTDHMRHPDGHSKIVGFCFDGYPIYGPFGYTDSNSASNGVKMMTTSYFLSPSQVIGRPYNFDNPVDLLDYILLAPQVLGHPHSYYNNPTDPLRNRLMMGPGAYVNDFLYNGSGTLDYYNGRYTKTPDFPNGTYAYFITMDASGIPQYPYIVGNYSKQKRTFTTTSYNTCIITSDKTVFGNGDTATITFTLGLSMRFFSNNNINVLGGSIIDLTGEGNIYTCTFVPFTDSTLPGSITVVSDNSTIFNSNTLTFTINTTSGGGGGGNNNPPKHTLKYISDIEHVNALMIDFTDYAGAVLKWSYSSSYDGVYLDDVLDGTTIVNNTQYHHIIDSNDKEKFFKAQIKNALDENYTDVAIIFINNDGYMGIVLDESITNIANGAFARGGGAYVDNIYKISHIFIPKSINIIGTDAFTDFMGIVYIESDSIFNADSLDSNSTKIFPSSSIVKTGASISDIIQELIPSTSNVTNSPIVGATVFYVDSDGVMLENSPIAITDKYGDFVMDFTGYNDTDRLYFQNKPLKITGGSNTLTGQSISYWYAVAGTRTMTPVTNLLFYCSADNALSNDDILTSLDFYDTTIDFANYNYYKTLINTQDTTSTTYLDALKANNLGNAINIFATIGAYFLYGINGTDIDTEYDAMMRSVANISTNNNGQNEFAELFGPIESSCATIISDRLKNQITNTDVTNNSYNGKPYSELFADALSLQMSNIITTIMSSTDFDTTSDYELIGYAVVQNVYNLISTLKPALANPLNDKQAILSYFTKNLAAIFTYAINNQLFDYDNNDTFQGYSPVQTGNNAKSSEQVMMRRQVVKSWNNAYASGIVNGAKRITSPFRAVNNLGDFLARENYVCGGPNQVNASKPGWKSRIGSMISNCDFTGIPSSTCNVKYVPDASDYIRYKKLRANNQNFNDKSNGGSTNSSYVDLMRVRRR